MTNGVGIVGAGPGVAALHLPTLARLRDDFDVVHIADARKRPGGGTRRAGRRALVVGDRGPARGCERSRSSCSPARRASTLSQILASVAAGKRAILCEKPLATTVDGCRGGDRGVPRRGHRAA